MRNMGVIHGQRSVMEERGSVSVISMCWSIPSVSCALSVESLWKPRKFTTSCLWLKVERMIRAILFLSVNPATQQFMRREGIIGENTGGRGSENLYSLCS